MQSSERSLIDAGVERAIVVALTAHAGQNRKGSTTPYVSHPLHVALCLQSLGMHVDVVQAGLLHDVVEDCDDWTLARLEAEFGPRVAAYVGELTEDKGRSWEERKQGAVSKVPRMSAEAATIKGADKLHNLSTLVQALRAAAHPDEVWRHFSRGPEQTLQLAEQLVAALQPRLPAALASNLSAVLGELRALIHGA
ncbi:MAG: HD domain-containing protein [Planctomycetota bacterium]